MSWFISEDYSINDNGFYGEPTITYGKSEDTTKIDSTGSSDSDWDSYQHEREHIPYYCDQHTR